MKPFIVEIQIRHYMKKSLTATSTVVMKQQQILYTEKIINGSGEHH